MIKKVFFTGYPRKDRYGFIIVYIAIHDPWALYNWL